jgi:hypothetical protein
MAPTKEAIPCSCGLKTRKTQPISYFKWLKSCTQSSRSGQVPLVDSNAEKANSWLLA